MDARRAAGSAAQRVSRGSSHDRHDRRALRLALTDLAEDERLFRDSVLEFARAEIAPHVRAMDEQATLAAARSSSSCSASGVMGIEVPEAHGGAGGTFFHSVLAVEALAEVDASVAVLVDVQNTLVVNARAPLGHRGAAGPYLPRLASSTVGAYALSEAGSGSDAFALTTRAVEAGDGFALIGRKLWITNGNEADVFIVFATIDPAAGYRGITAFIVERGDAGFTVGKKEDKLGIRASSTCELLFEDCRVPRDATCSARSARATRSRSRRSTRGASASARRCWARAGRARPRRSATRRSAGSSARPSPTSRPCSTRSRARPRRWPRRGCSSTTPRGCAMPVGRSSPRRRCASCSPRRSPSASASLAVNLFGGYGFVKDYPVEKLYRDAKIGQIYEGTSNLQLQTIAKQLLGWTNPGDARMGEAGYRSRIRPRRCSTPA